MSLGGAGSRSSVEDVVHSLHRQREPEVEGM